MESTGKYWIPVYNVLENDYTIVLAHPQYVKAIRGKKTDKKDAKWIADLFKHNLAAGKQSLKNSFLCSPLPISSIFTAIGIISEIGREYYVPQYYE